MIRWCAYCQSFQGEAPPYDDFSLTHTICPRCQSESRWKQVDVAERIAPVRELLARIADPGPDDTPETLVDEALELGVEPVDLLLGLVQPVLFEVGARWARGEATVAQEHEVTRRCLAIDAALRAKDPSLAPPPRREHPDVLLVCAPGNDHSIGLRMIALFLTASGLEVAAVTRALDAAALLRMVEALGPSVLGLSAALPEHLEAAEEVAARARALGVEDVVVGGRAVHGAAPPRGPIHYCPDFRELPSRIAKLTGRPSPTEASGRARIARARLPRRTP